MASKDEDFPGEDKTLPSNSLQWVWDKMDFTLKAGVSAST